MNYYKSLLLCTFILASPECFSEESNRNGDNQALSKAEVEAKNKATTDAEKELDKFGFGPALFFLKYNEEVLKDSKDVSVRGDGTISSNGSKYSVSLGLELHYDFSFWHKSKCLLDCNNSDSWDVTSSHRLSPYIGLFDIENGMNGMAVGLIYGYTKGDGNGANKTTLNFGVGWMVHKDRIVLARGVSEGSAPPAGLTAEDYTERKDVKGINLMISVNMGF